MTPTFFLREAILNNKCFISVLHSHKYKAWDHPTDPSLKIFLSRPLGRLYVGTSLQTKKSVKVNPKLLPMWMTWLTEYCLTDHS